MKKFFLSLFIFTIVSIAGRAQPNLIKDIRPGGNSGIDAGYIRFAFQNHMYFPAYDSLGDLEPWITDGTTNGTNRLYDINPGTTGSNPNSFFAFNGLVVFVATDAIDGTELWKTDGTTAGTSRINDINPGAGNGVTDYLEIIWIHNGYFYFKANDGVSGVEIWRSEKYRILLNT